MGGQRWEEVREHRGAKWAGLQVRAGTRQTWVASLRMHCKLRGAAMGAVGWACAISEAWWAQLPGGLGEEDATGAV